MKQKKTRALIANGGIAWVSDLPGCGKPLTPLEDHVGNAPEVPEYAGEQAMTHSRVSSSG